MREFGRVGQWAGVPRLDRRGRRRRERAARKQRRRREQDRSFRPTWWPSHREGLTWCSRGSPGLTPSGGGRHLVARWALAGALARQGVRRRARRDITVHDGHRKVSPSGKDRNSEGPAAPQVKLTGSRGEGNPGGPRGQELRHGQGRRWSDQQVSVRSVGGSRQGGRATPFVRVAPPPSWLGTCILLQGCRWARQNRWGRGGAKFFGPEYSSDVTGDGPASLTSFFRRVAGPAPVPAPGLLTGGTPFAPPPQMPAGPGVGSDALVGAGDHGSTTRELPGGASTGDPHPPEEPGGALVVDMSARSTAQGWWRRFCVVCNGPVSQGGGGSPLSLAGTRSAAGAPQRRAPRTKDMIGPGSVPSVGLGLDP